RALEYSLKSASSTGKPIYYYDIHRSSELLAETVYPRKNWRSEKCQSSDATFLASRSLATVQERH
ncbi:MAG TPA: hypothetical protein VH593_19475, partial [Ktedonobacteraceae bacterium]